jgi:hypothetical protein
MSRTSSCCSFSPPQLDLHLPLKFQQASSNLLWSFSGVPFSVLVVSTSSTSPFPSKNIEGSGFSKKSGRLPIGNILSEMCTEYKTRKS